MLVEKLGDKVAVHEMPLLAGNIFVFNTRKKISTVHRAK